MSAGGAASLGRPLASSGLALALGGLVALASSSADEEPFPREAEEGATQRRSFEFEAELALEELSVQVDGEPVPVGGDLEIELTERWRVVVEDDLGPPARGRPRSLVRWFEELSGSSIRTTAGPDGRGDSERELTGGLEGCSVRFALEVEDTGEGDAGEGDTGDDYRVEWDDAPCEQALLEGLREDMDLRAFLPEPGRELEPGDGWELPPRVYPALFDPGGVELRPADETELERRLAEEAREQVDGVGRATWLGRRETDDGEVSVIALELAVSTRASGPVPTEDEAQVELELAVELVLEGELAWSVDGGHLASLELAGSCERVEVLRATVDGGEREQRTRLAGEASYRVRVQRADR